MGRREDVIIQAKEWLGLNEDDNSYIEILNTYNEHFPLARDYAIKPWDSWCATFASAVAIKAGCTDIVPTEVSCYYMVEGFKKLGEWIEDESTVPQEGDYIFYDWSDNGIGDNRNCPDHVGIVVAVDDSTITVIEGNKNNAVEYRYVDIDGRYIRGFGRPKYEESIKKDEPEIIKNDYAQSYSKDVRGIYSCDTALYLRRGADISKSPILVMPEATKVICYGYYTLNGSTAWLYVTAKIDRITYTGFCSSKYLTKI